MYRFKYWLRKFFGFSQKETNGFIILTFIMVFLLFVPLIFTYLPGQQPGTENEDRKKLDSLIALWEEKKDAPSDSPRSSEKYFNTRSIKYFLFNPNTCSLEDFMKLGFHQYLSERIIKYRSKGGVFKIKSDLKKIYGFPPALYEKVAPYIDLPDSFVKTRQANFKKQVPYVKEFNVNTADTTALIKLKGIGSKLAIRIIKYRDKLGGFVDIGQYKEIFGLDSLALEELSAYALIDKDFIPVKIKLNSADLSSLSNHPYVGKRFAKVIFNYRQAHGSFSSLEELTNIKIIDPASHEKMKNYLTLE